MLQHPWGTQGELACLKDIQRAQKSANGYQTLLCQVQPAYRSTITMIERAENPSLFSSGQQSGDPLVGRSSVSLATL
jgi:hypothetical protein